MKKIILVNIMLLCIFLISACSLKKEEKTLSIEKVIELSKRENNLSWEDFEKYESKEVGSGLYILRYEINDKYHLIIGGYNKEQEPMYIRLASNENKEDFIDIRKDDVEGFISNHLK